MRNLPPLRAVVAFEAASRLGSMALAAEELRITPSAVSHRIATLEAHFGRPLFRRTPNGLEPLALSQRLAFRISCGLTEIAEGCRDFLDSGAMQPLDVHVNASLAAKWLRPRLTGFLLAHPSVALHIIDSAGPTAFRPGLDLALVYGSDAPAGSKPLLTESVHPLCSPILRERLPERPSIADLMALPLLHSRNAVRWPEWCRLMGAPPPPAGGLSFDRSHLAIDAASEGLGVVLESDILTGGERRSGRLVEPLAEMGASVPSVGYALLLPTAPLRAPMSAFVDWLRDQAAT
ncbi:MAG: lysR [Rubritepida sp.]|nr:lysR [Rubritepida sp.]